MQAFAWLGQRAAMISALGLPKMSAAQLPGLFAASKAYSVRLMVNALWEGFIAGYGGDADAERDSRQGLGPPVPRGRVDHPDRRAGGLAALSRCAGAAVSVALHRRMQLAREASAVSSRRVRPGTAVMSLPAV